MNRTLAVARFGAVCFCLLLMAACGAEEEDTAATPTATPPEATPGSPQPTTPGAANISSRGEEVEHLANSVVRRVTWEDGTTYEETIPDLVFRTALKPDAGHGHRVVARWLGGASWQVTIFMRVVDRSTEPATETHLQAEFYYDEEKDDFTAANGRGLFALTGRDSCAADEPEPEYCPLDEEVRP